MRWRSFGTVTGGRRIGRVRFPVALPLQPGDRMVLRSTVRRGIVGGAVVLDVEPARRTVDALSREEAGGRGIARAVAGGRFATVPTIARTAALDRADPLSAIVAGEAAGELERLGDRYGAPAAVDELVAAATRAVGGRADGLELTVLATRLGREPATLRVGQSQPGPQRH